ncbi:MAG: hypothetical protein GF333_02925 [Candidatus Omnitrophica bacterium]|nr:hypothetical protein [Candidatus Omnitrophota bacterium]
MLKTKGKITEMQTNRIKIKCERNTICSCCRYATFCGATEKEEFCVSPNPQVTCAPGDTVEIGISERAHAAGVFLLFAAPLILFIGTLWLTRRSWPALSFLAATGLMSGYYLCVRHRLTHHAAYFRPRILRRTEQGGHP